MIRTFDCFSFQFAPQFLAFGFKFYHNALRQAETGMKSQGDTLCNTYFTFKTIIFTWWIIAGFVLSTFIPRILSQSWLIVKGTLACPILSTIAVKQMALPLRSPNWPLLSPIYHFNELHATKFRKFYQFIMALSKLEGNIKLLSTLLTIYHLYQEKAIFLRFCDNI